MHFIPIDDSTLKAKLTSFDNDYKIVKIKWILQKKFT